MMNRRFFLSSLTLAPALALLPSLAKASDPLAGRSVIVGETIHLYGPAVFDNRYGPVRVDRCKFYFHGKDASIDCVVPRGHEVYISNSHFESLNF